MAILQKTSFAENIEKYQVLVNDTDPNSTYFKITELPDTFTGGKNAFLIQGSEFLVPSTIIKIEIKDAQGNIIYSEPGRGFVTASFDQSGNPIVTEYYEGTSKPVAVYVYPDTTTFGPCTITILGEVSKYYDGNGILTDVPPQWTDSYNVRWQKKVNVNPILANTTRIRFYKRPLPTITEIVQPIYQIVSGSKVNTGVYQSFANVKLSQLETFAGDVKRVKVFRTSQGDISDYDLIQDIYVEAKELLTTYGLSGSVVGDAGLFTNESLKKVWNTGSLSASLNSTYVNDGVQLKGSGNFTYTASLSLQSTNTYELDFDAFYSSSTESNLDIYISGSTHTNSSSIDELKIGTLKGITPTKKFENQIVQFKLDVNEPSASLYFSASQGEWHLSDLSLVVSAETAFSPDSVTFLTSVPTNVPDLALLYQLESVCMDMPSCLAVSETLPLFSSICFIASALNSAV
mgnify:CR=1 FL=1